MAIFFSYLTCQIPPPMKPLIPALIFAILLSALPEAARAQRFLGGISGGLNLSQLDGDDLVGFNKPGISVGPFVAVVLSDRWQFGMEMLYSELGSRKTLGDPLSAALDKIAIQAVEVPLLIRFQEWKFLLAGGVSYFRRINSKVMDYTGQDVSDRYLLQDNHISLVLGSAVFLQENWGLDVSWSKSLSNWRADPNANRFIGRHLTLKAFYLFK